MPTKNSSAFTAFTPSFGVAGADVLTPGCWALCRRGEVSIYLSFSFNFFYSAKCPFSQGSSHSPLSPFLAEARLSCQENLTVQMLLDYMMKMQGQLCISEWPSWLPSPANLVKKSSILNLSRFASRGSPYSDPQSVFIFHTGMISYM